LLRRARIETKGHGSGLRETSLPNEKKGERIEPDEGQRRAKEGVRQDLRRLYSCDLQAMNELISANGLRWMSGTTASPAEWPTTSRRKRFSCAGR
jgi:hypothetical protein